MHSVSTKVGLGDDILNTYYESLVPQDAGEDLREGDINDVLDLVQNAPSSGAFQVHRGERTFKGSLLKVDTLTFQELSTLNIEAGDRDMIIIAANEVIFDSEQLRVTISLLNRPSVNGPTPPKQPSFPPAVRPSDQKHGPNGRRGRNGFAGRDGESRDGTVVIFIFGELKARPGTIDTEALDANFFLKGADGGNGSVGGHGGTGQQGAKGRNAKFKFPKCRRGAGDGGDGGAGGRAGNGGNGGSGAEGADIVFYGPNSVLDIAKIFNVENPGGEGGGGNKAGERGFGGRGGSSGNWKATCGQGSSGRGGSRGGSGSDGADGADGDYGTLEYISDSGRPVGSLF